MKTGKNGFCHVVGAGDFSPALLQINKDDLVIAADGGYALLQQAGITPHLLLGDFDSLGFVPEGDEVLVLPRVKDETDVGRAIAEGKKRGFCRFALYGALGGSRFSHSLANLSLLLGLAKEGMEAVAVDPSCTVRVLGKGSHRGVKKDGFFSLFAAEEPGRISVCGAKYPLENATLSPSFPLGVSNEGDENTVVTVHEGYFFLVEDA